MAGENVQQYFLRDHATGNFFCSFCNKKYAKGTTSTRLRGHLTGEAKTGATRCLIVPQLVRDSLVTSTLVFPGANNYFCNQGPVGFLAQEHIVPLQNTTHLPLGETSEGMIGVTEVVMPPNETCSNPHQIVSGSFSPELYSDFGYQGGLLQNMTSTQNPLLDNFSSFSQFPNNFSNHMGVQLGPQFAFQTPLSDEVMQDRVQVQNNGTNFEPGQTSGNIAVQDYLLPNDGWISDQYWNSENVMTGQADQNRVQSCGGTVEEVPMVEGVQETGESASLTKRLVGDAFKINEEKIWSWLMDDRVYRIGIYGMGGVGKTTLMRHIQTRLEGESSFKVYWVIVSQNFSIFKLQNLIAKKIGLSFSDEEDEVERAKCLAQAIQAKRKCVLILDDLWNYFDVKEVGIPVGVNRCKLIITTRLLQVCRQMDCSEGNTIQVRHLSKEEAWILFTQELGNYGTEVEELAEAVSRECAGLPLGIRVMARSMKGICNVHTWRSTLDDLKESRVSKSHEMREEVFSVLKFSYLRLNDLALRECLSYCAFFPEDTKIDRNDLIEYMIVDGIIDARKRRKAGLDQGHRMLETLENACLLEGDTRYVWMHDLIRDMVILELREGSKTLVEAGIQLTELPDVEKWTENLVRVSLISNDIEVIPSGHTPRCPNLSTLLLRGNCGLYMIADSFFEQLQKLKVLDLSWCEEMEELPRSISDLVNLTALFLCRCLRLIHVPSLKNLEKLEKLDLNGCKSLNEMPQGVEFLLNLKYLDISRSGIEERRSGIIPMLPRLQVLKLCNEHDGDSDFSFRGSEVGGLKMLEILCCRFSDVGEFGEYMKSRERSHESLTDYCFFIASHSITPLTQSSHTPLGSLGSFGKVVKVSGGNFIDPLALPTDIEELHIYNSKSSSCKRLFPSKASLLNLETIYVKNLDGIEELFTMNEGEGGEGPEGCAFPFSNYSTHSLLNHSLLNLMTIGIIGCHKLKKLFPLGLLPNLHNLQDISVVEGNEMEEIFSTDLEEEEDEDGQEVLFDPLHVPRLTNLHLGFLPELRSIYKGPIVSHSLEDIMIVDCPKLKRRQIWRI